MKPTGCWLVGALKVWVCGNTPVGQPVSVEGGPGLVTSSLGGEVLRH